MKDVLAALKDLFDNNHPVSDVFVGLLPIAIWELLRFLFSALMTPGGKRKELKGKWAGGGTDLYVADPQKAKLAFTVTMKLKVRWTDIRGSATLATADGSVKEELKLRGAFYGDRFLRLNYTNQKKDQLGVIFLEFGSDNDKLDGTYTGFSPIRSTIVAGTVKLTRPPKKA
jgi:hypothetical protein